MFFNKSNMGNSNSAWAQSFKEIENKHNEAYKVISQAVTLEEQEKPSEAIEFYRKAIRIIDQTLAIQIACPENPDHTWEKAILMIQKMKKMRAEILMRINSIQDLLPSPDTPPSYEEATGTESNFPKTYMDLANALEHIKIEPDLNIYSDVIYKHDNVKIYFISSDGTVQLYSEPETMTIALTQGEKSEVPKAILKIGDWVYPLVPGVSPCFRTEYGAFILPDIYSSDKGASVGIILPPDTDADVYELLEHILHGIVGHQVERSDVEEVPEAESLSGKISNGLVNGAWYLSLGLIKSAEKIGEAMNYGTPKLISRITANNEAAEVNPKLIKGMQIAECTTKKVAQVSGFVADQVGVATVKLGRFLAPHIQKQGTRVLNTAFNIPEEQASIQMTGALTIAAGAIEGFSTVYRGLETSAGILGDSLKNNTVKVIEHKYGTTAAEVSGDTFSTVANVYTIGKNANFITPKGFIKKTAKGAGKGLVFEIVNPSSSKESNSYVSQADEDVASTSKVCDNKKS